MKRPIQACALLLALVVSVEAQQANVTSPVSQSQLKIDTFYVSRSPARAAIQLVYQDGSNNDIRSIQVEIPSAACGSATVPNLITAMMTVRSAETGTDVRKMNFRVMGYAYDNGCGLPAATLIP